MDNCIFCEIGSGGGKSSKVYEDEHTCAFLDINPINKYHTLVIPKQHFVNMFDVTEEALMAVMKTVKKIVDLYKQKLGFEDIQLLCNSGKYAQQEVFHLHVHIIPRFPDDGKNIKWKHHPELREEFDDLLKALMV